MSLLSIIIFLPFVLIPVILALPEGKNQLAKWIALGVTAVQLVIACVIWFGFDVALARCTVS